MVAPDAEALFAEHHQTLLRYLCRAIGQADAARDLTQDVFLRVSRSALPEGGKPEIRAWLFRIARNLVIDYHRQRALHADAAFGIELAERSAPQDVGLAVREALAALDATDRDVFLLREVVGLSYGEIARTCELTVDGVRARLYRTRLTLRDNLDAPIARQRARHMRLSGRAAAIKDGDHD